MPNFCLNKNAQPTGEHEVHNVDAGTHCLPNPENRIPLGSHLTCHAAVAEARRIYPNTEIDGCKFCATDCHTR